jgi:hypothetical protein
MQFHTGHRVIKTPFLIGLTRHTISFFYRPIKTTIFIGQSKPRFLTANQNHDFYRPIKTTIFIGQSKPRFLSANKNHDFYRPIKPNF